MGSMEQTETVEKVRICIICGGEVERPSTARGGWLRKYCNACKFAADKENQAICVHPLHPGPRMLDRGAFYLRHNSTTSVMSYCKMCVGLLKPKEK